MREFIQLIRGYRGEKFGPRRSFSGADMARVFWALEKRTGRARLASLLGIGEWPVRSIISYLSGNGMAAGKQMGYKLTEKGFELLGKAKKKIVVIKNVAPSELTYEKPAVAVQLRKGRIKNIVSLRDCAVREGALGITALAFSKGKLSIPFVASGFSEYVKKLEKEFALCDGDALLVAYGDRRAQAERGLWAAVLKVVE